MQSELQELLMLYRNMKEEQKEQFLEVGRSLLNQQSTTDSDNRPE